MRDLNAWLNSGRYLPGFMRDFHDQKDAFKALHDRVAVERHEYAKDVSWVVGQCYVIDIFLWWMAKHGYTLQRTRTKLPFPEITETIATARDARNAAFRAALFATSPTLPAEGCDSVAAARSLHNTKSPTHG